MDTMKRVLSAFLAMVLVFGMIPAPAFAEEAEEVLEIVEEVVETEAPAQTEVPSEMEAPAETEAPEQTQETTVPPQETEAAEPSAPAEEEEILEITEFEEITDSDEAVHDYADYEIPVTSYEAFKQAINADYAGDSRNILWEGADALVISENLTLPDNLTLNASALTVSPNVTFTAQGSLSVGKLEISGTLETSGYSDVYENLNLTSTGVLYFKNSGSMYLQNEASFYFFGSIGEDSYAGGLQRVYSCDTVEQVLEIAQKAAADKSGVKYDVSAYFYEEQTLAEDMTICPVMKLYISGECGLTIAQGATLTLNGGKMDCQIPVTVNQGGTLYLSSGENNWSGEITVNGTLKNDSLVTRLYAPLSIGETGSYSGTGKMSIAQIREGCAWNDVVTGLELGTNFIVTDSDSGFYWELISIAGKTQLSAPRNVQWHKSHDGSRSVGRIYWEGSQTDSMVYAYAMYFVDADGEEQEVFSYTNTYEQPVDIISIPAFTTFDFELKTGTYYFTVQTLTNPNYSNTYNAEKYYASEVVRSEDFVYTKPELTLGTPTNVNVTGFPTLRWDAPAGATSSTLYQVNILYSDDGERYWNYSTTDSRNRTSLDLRGMLSMEGWYSFRVRAVSDDITKANSSPWSHELEWANDAQMGHKPCSDPVYYDPANAEPVDESFFKDNVQGTGDDKSLYLNQKLVMKSSYTIPGDVYFGVGAKGSIVVPKGVTLTIQNYMSVNGGSITVEEGGTLKINGNAHFRSGAVLELQGNLSMGANANLVAYTSQGADDCTINGVDLDKITLFIQVDDQNSIAMDLDRFQDTEEGYKNKVLQWMIHGSLPENEDLYIPAGYSFEVGNYENGASLTIPYDSLVQNYGSMSVWYNCEIINFGTIESYRGLNIYDTLTNNGDIIVLTPGGAQYNSVMYVPRGGIVNDWGNIYVDENAQLIRENGSIWRGEIEFDDFAQQLEETEGSLNLYGEVELEENYVIPAGTYVNIFPGGKLTVPEGVTLTVNGGLNLMGGDLDLNGTLNLNVNLQVKEGAAFTASDYARINYGNDAWVELYYRDGNYVNCEYPEHLVDYRRIQVRYALSDAAHIADTLNAFLEGSIYYGRVVLSWMIRPQFDDAGNETVTYLPGGTNLLIPENGILQVQGYNGWQDTAVLGIPSDATLEVQGEVSIWENSAIYNEGNLLIQSNGFVDVYGALRNLNYTRIEGVLGIEKPGTVNNQGTVMVLPNGTVNRVSGSTWLNNPTTTPFAAFKKQVEDCNQIGMQVEVNGENIVLEENITVNAPMRLWTVNPNDFESAGSRIVIPKGKTLTINGDGSYGGVAMMNSAIEVQSGGALVLNNRTYLNPGSRIIVQPGGKVTVNHQVDVYDGAYFNVRGTITTGGGAGFVFMDNAGIGEEQSIPFVGVPEGMIIRRVVFDDFADANMVMQKLNEEPNGYGMTALLIRANMELNGEYTIPAHGIVHLENGAVLTNNIVLNNFGAIYVYPGATLYNNGDLWQHRMLNVQGTLTNFGLLHLGGQNYESNTTIAENAIVNNREEQCDGSDNCAEVKVYPGAKLTYSSENWQGHDPIILGGTVDNGVPVLTQKQLEEIVNGGNPMLGQPARLTGDLTLKQQLVIDENGVLYVPKGKTLTVNEGMMIHGTLVVEEGGKLVQNRANEMQIVVHGNLVNSGEYVQKDTYGDGWYFGALLEGENGSISGIDKSLITKYYWTSGDLTQEMLQVPEGYRGTQVNLSSGRIPGGNYHIPYNTTVILNGECTMDSGATIDLDGMLWANVFNYNKCSFTNNGRINVNCDAEFRVSGDVHNYGKIYVYDAGRIRTWESFERSWDGNKPILVGGFTNDPYFGQSMTEEEFRAAYGNKDEEYYFLDTFVCLNKSMTLNKKLLIGPNGGLMVQSGATLTVDKGVEVVVWNGGDLVIGWNSKIINSGTVTSESYQENNGCVTVIGGQWLGNPLEVHAQWDGSSIYSLPYTAGMNFESVRAVFSIENEQQLFTALGYTDTLSQIEISNFIAPTGKLVIPDNAEVMILPNATLNLAYDATLYGSLVTCNYETGVGTLLLAKNEYDPITLEVKANAALINRGNLMKDDTAQIFVNYGCTIQGVPDVFLTYESDLAWNDFVQEMKKREEDYNNQYYELDELVVMGGNFTALYPILQILPGGHLVVPNGKTLTVQGIDVMGGRITVEAGGTLNVKGQLNISEYLDGTDGIVLVHPGGKLMNSGNISIGGGDYYYEGEYGEEVAYLGGGILNCQGTYTPTGKHNVKRWDVSYEDGELNFTGAVEGIDPCYQDLETFYVQEEETLYDILETLPYYGFRSGQIALMDNEYYLPVQLELNEDVTIPENWGISGGTIINYANFVVNGDLCSYVVNEGSMLLDQYAYVTGYIGGNVPTVVKNAAVKPLAKSITITGSEAAVVTKNNTVTVNFNDVIQGVYTEVVDGYWDFVKPSIGIRVNGEVWGDYEDVPIQLVSITSSNPKVLNAEDIVYNAEDCQYYINNVGQTGSTKLTITTIASKSVSRQDDSFRFYSKLTGTPLTYTVTVNVVADKAADLQLDLMNPEEYNNEYDEDTGRLIKAVFSKESVRRGYPLMASAFDAQDRFVDKDIVWTTSDKSLAAVVTGPMGESYLELQPNAYGSAVITATVKDQKEITASFEILVMDMAPRLGSDKITLNPYLEEGVKLELVESYGNIITGISVDNNALDVKQYGDEFFLVAKDPYLKKQTMKNVTLHVYTYTGRSYDFLITVTVNPTMPKVTVKQPTKLDLFYIDNKTPVNITTDAVIENVWMTETEDFMLIWGWSEETDDYVYVVYSSPELDEKLYEDAKYKPDVTANLYIQLEGYRIPAEVKNFKINTTTSNPGLKFVQYDAKGKLVNPAALNTFLENTLYFLIADKSGNVLDENFTINVTEEGAYVNDLGDGTYYMEFQKPSALKNKSITVTLDHWNFMRPVEVKLNLKVNHTIPTVKPVTGTLKLNTLFPAQAVGSDLSLSMDVLDRLNFEGFEATKPNDNTEQIEVYYDFNAGQILAKLNGTPAKGTYTFKSKVYATNVEEELVQLKDVEIKVQVVDAKPKLKLKTNNLTLSSAYHYAKAATTWTLDQDYELVGLDCEPVNEKLRIECYPDGTLVASIVDHEDPPAPGKYQFKATPVVSDGENSEKLDPVTITITVENKKTPEVKLSSTSITMNTQMIAEFDTETDEILNGEFAIIPVTFTNKTGYPDLYLYGAEFSYDHEDHRKYVEARGVFGENGMEAIQVWLKEGTPAGTYKVTVTPHVHDSKDPDQSIAAVKELKSITLTVKVVDKAVTVSAKTSGKLDVLNPESELIFTVNKVNNAQMGVVPEFDEDGNFTGKYVQYPAVNYAELPEGVNDNDLFELSANGEFDDKGQPIFRLRLNHTKPYDLKKTYKVTLVYHVWGGKQVAQDYTFKVSQSNFKAAPVNANVNYFLSSGRDLFVEIRNQTPNTVIGQVKVNKSTAKDLMAALDLKADEVLFDINDAEVVADPIVYLALPVKTTGTLQHNKTYNLVLDVTPFHGADNGKSATVTFKVKIIK